MFTSLGIEGQVLPLVHPDLQLNELRLRSGEPLRQRPHRQKLVCSELRASLEPEHKTATMKIPSYGLAIDEDMRLLCIRLPDAKEPEVHDEVQALTVRGYKS
jgi:hypothetical protein